MPAQASASDRAHFRFVVIGAGPCGGRAAIELATRAGPGQVALVGEEPLPPYERPPLSKAFLTAALPATDPTLLFDADRLERAGIAALLATRAMAIDRTEHAVALGDGRRLTYERLLIATGAAPRRLSIPGAGLPGVHYLRSFSDARALREAIGAGKRAVVVGGGFIGLETAASARACGLDVTIVEAGAQLMSRAVPPSVASAVARKFAAERVAVRMQAPPVRFEGRGRVESVVLPDGSAIAADIVVVGIGAAPNVALAEAAGLEVGDGILVGGDGRTSDSDIFAAGDVANRLVPGLDARRRLEAWEPAMDQGGIAATAMLGGDPRPERAPWMWSDQFDWNIQTVGYPGLADRETVHGNPDGDSFLVLQTLGGRLVGAVGLNRGKDIAHCRRAVARGNAVDVKRAASTATLNEIFAG